MSNYSAKQQNYWKEVSKGLDGYVQSRRDHDVENFIKDTLAFICYSTENVTTKVNKNHADKSQLDTYLIIAIDSLRGLLRAQEELSLMTLVLITRTSFEIHCNLKYMLTHVTPSILISRNYRFAEVEKYKHSGQPGAARTLSQPEKDAIKTKCPEWFGLDGKFGNNYFWNAEKGKNFREVAKSLGMEEEYVQPKSFSNFLKTIFVTFLSQKIKPMSFASAYCWS